MMVNDGKPVRPLRVKLQGADRWVGRAVRSSGTLAVLVPPFRGAYSAG